MNIEDLIEQLKDLKEKHGNLKVKLLTSFTREDERYWDEYDVDQIYYTEDGFYNTENMIVIEGKENE